MTTINHAFTPGSHRVTTKLEKQTAPPFWTRWAVVVDGQRIGTVERKGMSSGWYAYGRDGRSLGSWVTTRAAAVARVEDQP